MYFIAPVSTVDKHLLCVSVQIPESLCELSELQSGSVTDTVMNRQVKSLASGSLQCYDYHF